MYHKYPSLHSKSNNRQLLVDRLGKAITQRRQYLRYCRQHRDKTSKDTEPGLSLPSFGMLAPAIHVYTKLFPARKSSFSTPKSTLAPTQASALVLTADQTIEEEAVDDTQSQTSYATSLDEHNSGCDHVIQFESVSKGIEHLSAYTVGKFKQSGIRKRGRKCTLSLLIAIVTNFHRKHVLRDLRPYVCTFEDCELQLFPDRRTWFSHELKNHRRE